MPPADLDNEDEDWEHFSVAEGNLFLIKYRCVLHVLVPLPGRVTFI